MAVVKLEGQDIPLDDTIATSDDLIRKALSPFYPDVANAEIKRETKDGQVIITVVKRAGPKGRTADSVTGVSPMPASVVLTVLIAAPNHASPAVALCLEIQRMEAAGSLTPERLLALRPQIDAAITEAEPERHAVDQAWRVLRAAPAIPAASVPIGF